MTFRIGDYDGKVKITLISNYDIKFQELKKNEIIFYILNKINTIY